MSNHPTPSVSPSLGPASAAAPVGATSASGRTTRLSSGSLARRSYALSSRQPSTGTQSLQASGSQFAAALLGFDLAVSEPRAFFGGGQWGVEVDLDSDADASHFESDAPDSYLPAGDPLAGPPVDTRRSRSASRDRATAAGSAPITFTPVASTTAAGARRARLEALAVGPQVPIALPPAASRLVLDPLVSLNASTWVNPRATRGMTASQREGPTENEVRIAFDTASTVGGVTFAASSSASVPLPSTRSRASLPHTACLSPPHRAAA